jgi:hypothetical protein
MINPTITHDRSAVRVQILIGLIAALTIGCQTVQFKSRLMEKNKSEGTQYKKSAAELRIYLDELTGILSGTIEQAADHAIEAQRMNTLTELESVGNRILGKAQRQTEQLIDHRFFRMLQLIAISLLCMVVLVDLLGRLKGKRKGGPCTD